MENESRVLRMKFILKREEEERAKRGFLLKRPRT